MQCNCVFYFKFWVAPIRLKYKHFSHHDRNSRHGNWKHTPHNFTRLLKSSNHAGLLTTMLITLSIFLLISNTVLIIYVLYGLCHISWTYWKVRLGEALRKISEYNNELCSITCQKFYMFYVRLSKGKNTLSKN